MMILSCQSLAHQVAQLLRIKALAISAGVVRWHAVGGRLACGKFFDDLPQLGNLLVLAAGAADQAAQHLADRVIVLRDAVGAEFFVLRGHVGTLARFRGQYACRYANSRGTRGHGFDDHGIAANFGTIAHHKAAEHFGACAHHHVFAQRGVALSAFVERGAAEGNALVNCATIADLCGFADYGAHGVVKKYALAQHSTGVNLNARDKARQVRDKTPQPFEPVRPAPVRGAVQHHGVQAGVAGDHLPSGARSGVAVKDALDIGADSGKHATSVAF
jgi:hypothetical protein